MLYNNMYTLETSLQKTPQAPSFLFFFTHCLSSLSAKCIRSSKLPVSAYMTLINHTGWNNGWIVQNKQAGGCCIVIMMFISLKQKAADTRNTKQYTLTSTLGWLLNYFRKSCKKGIIIKRCLFSGRKRWNHGQRRTLLVKISWAPAVLWQCLVCNLASKILCLLFFSFLFVFCNSYVELSVL